jgi:hypothetical protein
LDKTQQAGGHQFILFWSGIALLTVLLGFVVLPTLNLGLVADDFFLLVPDQRLPLTQSSDELHRPMRNVVLRTVESQLGIQHVLPYRLLIGSSFVAALFLVFRLTRRLRANRLGALAGVFALAFFPRNQEVLYWFAAWQDLVAAVAVLCACLFFLDFRESNRLYSLGVAAIAYLVALGFKETTVVLPALLLSIDVYRERSLSSLARRRFWGAYIPFACILLVYVVYFFSQSGAASLAGAKTGGYYGFHGFAGVAAGVFRAMINIGLPYWLPLGLKDIRLWHVAVLLFELGVVLFLVWRLHLWPALLLAASWVVCTILPTATFAAAFNADRYLFVPTLGVAVFVGLLAHALFVSPEGAKYSVLLCVALALYTAVGISQLVINRELWRRAGKEAAMVVRETMRLCATLPAGSEVDVINLTHSLQPRGVVFANGLSEALHANGLSSSVRILRNFSAADAEQQRLIAELQQCVDPRPDALKNRTMLIESGGQILKLDPGCASSLVDDDRAQRPSAWGLLYSGQ